MSKSKKRPIAGYFFILMILIIFALAYYQGIATVDDGTNMSTNHTDPNFSPYAGGHNFLSISLNGFGLIFAALVAIFMLLGALYALKEVFHWKV